MNILVRSCLRRAHLVEDLVESWQIEHVSAMWACDLEELVRECLDLSLLLNRGWDEQLDLLFDEKIDDIDRVGKTLQLAVDVSLKVFRHVQRLVADAARNGYSIERSKEFDKVVEKTAQLKTEITKRWPSVNHSMIRESMSAYERGEYQTAEDMLHELENDSSKAHQ